MMRPKITWCDAQASPALLLLVVTALIAGCGSSSGGPGGSDATIGLQPDAAIQADGRSPAEPDGIHGEARPQRVLVQRSLFGDTHPQNLLIDPTFSVRMGGVGNWIAYSEDPSSYSATSSSSLMSDSPSGIAMPVGRISDGRSSVASFQLDMIAQVAGGPGPFRLRVWISTLDAAASASLSGVTVGLLTSQYGKAIEVKEDPAKSRIMAGRTWHLFTGTIDQSLTLGGFVLFAFKASKNTWLIQAPEFIPVALAPPETTTLLQRPAARPRPLTDHEQQLIKRYQRQPRISVPAGHRSLREEPRRLLRH